MTATPPDREALVAALADNGRALAARAGSPAAAHRPVAACPGWDVARVGAHVGSLHRWVETMVRTGARDRLSRGKLFPEPAPGSGVDLEAWMLEGLHALVATLGAAEEDRPVWSWVPGRGDAAFWWRRMAHETALHRWDADQACDRPTAMDPALAVDGIDELFSTYLPAVAAAGPERALGVSLHVHTTGGEGGEWTVAADWSVTRGHSKGDAAVRGGAADVLLWLWGRPVPPDAVEVVGDPAAARRWLEAARF